MNYFAHALPFLDRPYLAVATGLPDMLVVADRRVRVRSKHVLGFVDHADSVQSAVARGMIQHFRDDAAFHDTRTFAELNLATSAAMRDALDGDSSMRPRLLGHLLVEVFLDAALVEERPDRLEAYYGALATVDAERIQEAFNRMSPRATFRLAEMIRRIERERFLWDYLDDERLLVRLNQILGRVGLEPLPAGVRGLFAVLRRQVAERKGELLVGIPVRAAWSAGMARKRDVA